MATQKTKQKIVSAFLSLLAEKGWTGFDMSDVAEGAGVKLSVLRGAFATKTACFKAFVADIDQTVLDRVDPEMSDEPARDRLFDVLMTRLDALQPHREAVRALMTAARKDPQLALTLNADARVSQRWMLTAAGLPSSGVRAQMIAQGLVVAFSRVVDVWLDDEDPGLARTMSALDRQLDDGEVWLSRLDRAGRMLKPLMRRARTSRPAPSQSPDPDAPASPSAV
ncbi:TetR/AcrR family transcriptional regulator [Stappia sp. ES.058]|uniref:TetR/AcrR family transcriptional regulator n=1 Tax=Stappia sp. ES.058 TaxID=1881061 RepID=UPI00087D2F46|nr:TetR/AcrR family transcriptional regulator [Stappia sp. ES.058]SDU29155.1 transcriptional regulator, TetR family [Stappia sp. ES.058]